MLEKRLSFSGVERKKFGLLMWTNFRYNISKELIIFFVLVLTAIEASYRQVNPVNVAAIRGTTVTVASIRAATVENTSGILRRKSWKNGPASLIAVVVTTMKSRSRSPSSFEYGRRS